MNFSPPQLTEHAGVIVVRDDLLPGGTKARVLPLVLDQLAAAAEVVYASPAYGYAQVALGYAAKATGRHATVFVAKRNDPHPRTVEAIAAGAAVVAVSPGYMSVCRARASEYAAWVGATLLPFGLDTPEMQAALADAARTLDISPHEVWVAAGSGTLTRALQAAWPDAAHHAVRVGAAPDVGSARLWEAPEPFERPARRPPPFPSCDNYDAKVWQFIEAHASPGALFWNVAS